MKVVIGKGYFQSLSLLLMFYICRTVGFVNLRYRDYRYHATQSQAWIWGVEPTFFFLSTFYNK